MEAQYNCNMPPVIRFCDHSQDRLMNVKLILSQDSDLVEIISSRVSFIIIFNGKFVTVEEMSAQISNACLSALCLMRSVKFI